MGYMFGPDVLVAPVYLSNVTSQNVVLPPANSGGTWMYAWSNTSYKGDQMVNISTPIGYPPVFYRSDSKFRDTFDKLKDVHEVPVFNGDNMIGRREINLSNA